jgi:hypothetical protein
VDRAAIQDLGSRSLEALEALELHLLLDTTVLVVVAVAVAVAAVLVVVVLEQPDQPVTLAASS